MRLFDGFRTVPTFEHWSGQLRLSATHAVVGSWPEGWSGVNRLPHNRLYLVAGPATAGEIRLGSQRVAMRGGRRYLMPAGQRLDLRFAPGLRMVAFHFDLELGLGIDLFASCRSVLDAAQPIAETRRFASLLRSLDGPSALIAASGRLALALADMVPLQWRDLEHQRLVQGRWSRVFARIDHDGAATRIGELARDLSVSADQLSKRFRRDFGVPLKTVIDQRVTRRAAELLRESDLGIAEIAEELGFANEFYASRFLTRHLGMNPSRYRRLDITQLG